MGRVAGTTRITFSNDNVSGVLGHVLSVLADKKVNVIDMMNKSRGELAFNIIDVENKPGDEVISRDCCCGACDSGAGDLKG